ncbi:MAG: hypothetical protein QOF76_2370 [Solirubrobacteraceae bacterium]|jgi:RNA polymerase sigma factor (sigma-70 family)|nr:hypothetical protein [Solirubrobacteraceae bacterium]
MSVLTAEDPVAAVVREHGASLRWLARQHSLCLDDADDACQRALEIWLRRRADIEPARVGSWLRTVCKHEAMHIRAARQRVLPEEEVAWDEHPAPDAAHGEDGAAARQLVDRAAEALGGCKPAERRALLLRADGCSYAEIGALSGWSYTKVNRLLTEGRRRFLRRFALIESGSACRAYARVLSLVVDGEASVEDYVALRPHLRHCGGCRATLRAMYDVELFAG